MNTTVSHTKINEAVTKQAVTEDAMTQCGGNQGQRISILTILGHGLLLCGSFKII